MIGLDQLLSIEIVHRLGWMLLHSLWQGALVAGVMALLLMAIPSKKSNFRYLIGCLSLLVIPVLCGATFCMVETPTSVNKLLMPVASQVSGEPPALSGTPLTVTYLAEDSFPAEKQTYPGVATPNNYSGPLPAETWHEFLAHLAEPLLPWSVLVWGLGVFALSVWHLGGWIAMYRLRIIGTSPAAEGIVAIVQLLSARLRINRSIRVLQSVVIQTPAVIGYFRPVILLPISILTGLSSEQIEAIIAHELAHIRRYDYLVGIVQTAIETLLFHHPAVWWISHRIRVEREHCCDDLAVAACGNAVVYAEALTEIVALRGRSPKLAAAARDGSLFKRIRRLLDLPPAKTSHVGRSIASVVVIAAMFACGIGIRIHAAGSEQNEEKPGESSVLEQPATDPQEHAAKVEDLDPYEVAERFLQACVLGEAFTAEVEEVVLVSRSFSYVKPQEGQRQKSQQPPTKMSSTISVKGRKVRIDEEVKRFGSGNEEPDYVTQSVTVFNGKFLRYLSKVLVGKKSGDRAYESAGDAMTTSIYEKLIHWPAPVTRAKMARCKLSLEPGEHARQVVLCAETPKVGTFKYFLELDKGAHASKIESHGWDVGRPTGWRGLRNLSEYMLAQVDGGWYPVEQKTYKIDETGTRKLERRTKLIKLTRNADIPDELFAFEFPPGTEVYYSVARKSLVVGKDETPNPDVYDDPAAIRQRPERRTRYFPPDRSVGVLAVRDWDSREESAWEHLGEARGKVEVPAGKLLRLTVNDETAGDTFILGRLRARSIQSLTISSPRLTDEQLRFIGGMTGLQWLDLRSTGITDVGLKHLTILTSLQELDLRDTKVTPSGLAALQQSLPDCHIRASVSNASTGSGAILPANVTTTASIERVRTDEPKEENTSADSRSGQYHWRIDCDTPLYLCHGWYTLIDGEVREHAGGGTRTIATAGVIGLGLSHAIRDGMLELRITRTEDLVESDQRTGKNNSLRFKTLVPDNTIFVESSDVVVSKLNEKYQALWEGRWIRGGKIVKRIIYVVRVAAQYDPTTGFDKHELRRALVDTRMGGPQTLPTSIPVAEPTDHLQEQADRDAFVGHAETSRFLLRGGKRDEAAMRFQAIADRSPQSRYGRIAGELANLLAQMAEEDEQYPEPDNPASLSEQQRIKYYVFKLRDVAEQSLDVPGKCRVLFYPHTPNSAAVALRKIGKPVIPVMLDLLNDPHPTRSYSNELLGNHLLRYSDLALEIIEAIACRKFDSRTAGRGLHLSNADQATRALIIARARTWWKENRDRTESQWIRESLLETGIGAMWNRLESAERLIELEGARSIAFFHKRAKAEPDNPHMARLLFEAGGKTVLDDIRAMTSSQNPEVCEAAERVLQQIHEADAFKVTEATTISLGDIVYDKSMPETQTTRFDPAETVTRFFEEVRAGNRDAAVKFADPKSAIPQQIDEIKQVLEQQEVTIERVYAGEQNALTITSSVKADRGRAGQLLITLVKQGNNWLINDIDMETEQSAEKELKRFLQRFPDARLFPGPMNIEPAQSDETASLKGMIAGTVSDANNQPAQDVHVCISPLRRPFRKSRLIQTDRDGHFRVDKLVEGQYFVSAFSNVPPPSKGGFEYKHGHLMGFQHDVVVGDGGESTVHLQPAGTGTLTVTLEKPPHHLEWGIVLMALSPIELPAPDRNKPAHVELPSDLLGFFFVEPGKPFSIHNVPTGVVHVRATPSDPGPMDFSPSTPIEIKPGSEQSVTLQLQPRLPRATKQPAAMQPAETFNSRKIRLEFDKINLEEFREQFVVSGGEWTIENRELISTCAGDRSWATYQTHFKRLDSVLIRARIVPPSTQNLRIWVGPILLIFNWELADQNHYRNVHDLTTTSPHALTPGTLHDIELRQVGSDVIVTVDGKTVYATTALLQGTVSVQSAWNSTVAIKQIKIVGESDPSVVVFPLTKNLPDSPQAQSETRVGDTHRIEGDLEFDKHIAVKAKSPAGDSQYMAGTDWIEFTRSRDQVKAKLRVVYPSGPKARWRAKIELLDPQGKVLASAEITFENSGIIKGIPLQMDETLEFDVGTWDEVSTATRFAVTLGQLSGPGSPTALLKVTPDGKFIIPAEQAWCDTGMDIEKGQKITFLATGEVHGCKGPKDDWAYGPWTPEGMIVESGEYAGQCLFALMGRIGTHKLYIGKGRTITAPNLGRLYLGVSDFFYKDNQGAFIVEVTSGGEPIRHEPVSRQAVDAGDSPEQIPRDTVRITHVDETAEDKRSLGASGHAVEFQRTQSVRFVEAVQIFASRYGHRQAPDEDFHLYLLNNKQQVLADLQYSYAMIERGEMRWYTLRTPSVEVTETFCVALAFNPHQTKGVYLGLDKSVKRSHSLVGLPRDGFEKIADSHDWMVRVYLSEQPSAVKGVQRLADWQAPRDIDPFKGCIEGKYDNGKSEGMQSYGDRGPAIRFELVDIVSDKTSIRTLRGIRLYASRYGSGYDTGTTTVTVTLLDADGKVLAEQPFPYSLFSYKPKWVDLPLEKPISLDAIAGEGQSLMVAFDPKATRYKGIYFHYNKNPESSHSLAGTVTNGFRDTPDREWMIRIYLQGAPMPVDEGGRQDISEHNKPRIEKGVSDTHPPPTANDGWSHIFSGRVTDTSGQPVAGAVVEWGWYLDGYDKRERTATDKDGRYRLVVTRHGASFRLGVSADNLAPRWKDIHPDWWYFAGAEQQDVPAEVDFTLEPAHWIGGVVVNEQGQPIPGVRVRAQTAETGFYSSFSSPAPASPIPGQDNKGTTTDHEGRFRLEGLPAEYVNLNVRADYRHVNDQNYPVDQHARIVMCGSGRRGIIRARLIDKQTSKPVRDFKVALRYHPEQMHLTPADGRFTLNRDFTEGNTYSVYVYSRDHAPINLQIRATPLDGTEEQIVELSPGEPLLGQLADANTKEPLSRIPILYGVIGKTRYFEWPERDTYIDGHHGFTYVQRAMTAPDGTFFFCESSGVEKGALVIIAEGYERMILKPENRPEQSASGRIQIRLKPEASFSGVYLKDGVPQANMEISIRKQDPRVKPEENFERVRTDEQGRYRIGSLAPGRYSFSVAGRFPSSFVLAAGEQKIVNPGEDLGP